MRHYCLYKFTHLIRKHKSHQNNKIQCYLDKKIDNNHQKYYTDTQDDLSVKDARRFEHLKNDKTLLLHSKRSRQIARTQKPPAKN